MQVVVKKQVFLIEHLDPHPGTSTLLPRCEQESLIAADQKSAIITGLSTGAMTKMAANTRLLEILRKTGNKGYLIFKKILHDLAKESMTKENIYREIDEKETEVRIARTAEPSPRVSGQVWNLLKSNLSVTLSY